LGGVLGLILLLAIAAGALALAAVPGAGASSGSAPAAAGPVYTWQENGALQSATLDPGQVQIFLKSGAKPAAVGQRLAETVAGQNGAPAPQSVGQGRLLVQVPSGSGTATDRLQRAQTRRWPPWARFSTQDPSVQPIGWWPPASSWCAFAPQ
jgi:hypothetical protein